MPTEAEGNAEATSAPALKDEFLDMRAHLLLVSSHMPDRRRKP
jgi:hypothetical protein